MRRIPTLLVALFLITACSKVEAGGNPQVVFETNRGSFTLELFSDKAPETVKNFLTYVDAKFYDGLIFHRVIPGFMIQGGGFDTGMQKKAVRGMIRNEATNGIKNVPGTVAMARTSAPNSATSQFFINVNANVSLDHRSPDPRGMGYCVFGKIIAGMDIVTAIEKTPTRCPSKSRAPCNDPAARGMRDVPQDPVIIKTAKLKK